MLDIWAILELLISGGVLLCCLAGGRSAGDGSIVAVVSLVVIAVVTGGGVAARGADGGSGDGYIGSGGIRAGDRMLVLVVVVADVGRGGSGGWFW